MYDWMMISLYAFQKKKSIILFILYIIRLFLEYSENENKVSIYKAYLIRYKTNLKGLIANYRLKATYPSFICVL